jgi:hypothetical protein
MRRVDAELDKPATSHIPATCNRLDEDAKISALVHGVRQAIKSVYVASLDHDVIAIPAGMKDAVVTGLASFSRFVEKNRFFSMEKTVPAKIVFAGRKKPPGQNPAKLAL